MFYSNESIAILIDGQNFTSTAKSLDLEVDFQKLRQVFAKKSRLVWANYYTTVQQEKDGTVRIRPLLDFLTYNGWKTVTRLAREYMTDDGQRRIKGDMTVDITIGILMAARKVDHIILASGDGDYAPAIEAAQREGARVSVLSSQKGQSTMVSDWLRRSANDFIELNDLASEIRRVQVPEDAR